jgi:hypothetical protein
LCIVDTGKVSHKPTSSSSSRCNTLKQERDMQRPAATKGW